MRAIISYIKTFHIQGCIKRGGGDAPLFHSHETPHGTLSPLLEFKKYKDLLKGLKRRVMKNGQGAGAGFLELFSLERLQINLLN